MEAWVQRRKFLLHDTLKNCKALIGIRMGELTILNKEIMGQLTFHSVANCRKTNWAWSINQSMHVFEKRAELPLEWQPTTPKWLIEWGPL
jgi:hypothetical protein